MIGTLIKGGEEVTLEQRKLVYTNNNDNGDDQTILLKNTSDCAYLEIEVINYKGFLARSIHRLDFNEYSNTEIETFSMGSDSNNFWVNRRAFSVSKEGVNLKLIVSSGKAKSQGSRTFNWDSNADIIKKVYAVTNVRCRKID